MTWRSEVPLKKYPSIIYALVAFLLVAASMGLGQSRSSIGTFDIEKVRQAVSGRDSSSDSTTGAIEKAPVRKSESVAWLTIRIGLYLALIAGAIFCVTWLIKRFGLVGRSKIGGGSMDLLEALSIGPNKTILLVRVKDMVFILAQTPSQITLLDKVEGDRALELISSSRGGVSISQFKEVFDGFMGKIKKPQ
jgi:flagellar biosynthetic protein FliO